MGLARPTPPPAPDAPRPLRPLKGGRPRRRRPGRPPAEERDDPVWEERQRRVAVYRRRLEQGLGLFSDDQPPERPIAEVLAELRAERQGRVARG